MSTEGNSLEQLIDGHAEADPIEAVAPPTPEPSPEPTGETNAAPPAADQQQPPDDGPMVPRRALEDERRKRQDLSDKLEEMQKWVQQQFQQQRQPQLQHEQQPQAPDMWTDPEGAVRHMLTRERENYERQLFVTRVEHGQEVLRMRHADYDEVEKIFISAAQSVPHLQAELMRSANPARFAYETGRRIKLMQEIGDDPEAYIERKIAERAANGGGAPSASPQPNAQAPTRSTAPVPKSLASTASAAPRNERGQFTERVPIEQLLG